MGRGQGERRVGPSVTLSTARHCARRSFVVALAVVTLIVALCACHRALCEKGIDSGRWAEAKESVEFGRVSRSSILSRSSIACCRARRSLVVALIDCLSSRSSIARRCTICRASRSALRAKGVDSGRWAAAGESVEFGRGGRRASTVVW
jgi:hypothetical protein